MVGLAKPRVLELPATTPRVDRDWEWREEEPASVYWNEETSSREGGGCESPNIEAGGGVERNLRRAGAEAKLTRTITARQQMIKVFTVFTGSTSTSCASRLEVPVHC